MGIDKLSPTEQTTRITSWIPSTEVLLIRARRSAMLATPIMMIEIQLIGRKLRSEVSGSNGDRGQDHRDHHRDAVAVLGAHQATVNNCSRAVQASLTPMPRGHLDDPPLVLPEDLDGQFVLCPLTLAGGFVGEGVDVHHHGETVRAIPPHPEQGVGISALIRPMIAITSWPGRSMVADSTA